MGACLVLGEVKRSQLRQVCQRLRDGNSTVVLQLVFTQAEDLQPVQARQCHRQISRALCCDLVQREVQLHQIRRQRLCGLYPHNYQSA